MTGFFLEVLLKATAGLLLAGAAAALIRRSASLRYVIWSGTLAGLIVLPVMAKSLPRLQVSLPAIASPPDPAAPEVERTAALTEAAGSSKAPLDSGQVARLGLALWLSGVVVLLARLGLDLGRVGRLTRRARAPVRDEIATLVGRVARDLGIQAPVRACVSDEIEVAATWGFRHPVLLLPAAAETWPADRLEMVLLHELAHVRRADYPTHLLAQLACAAYWPHPGVWLAAHRARLEQERACDDEVLARGVSPHEYARLLVDIARGPAGRLGIIATGMGGRRSSLALRIRAILSGETTRPGLPRTAHGAAAALTLAVWLPLAAVGAACVTEPIDHDVVKGPGPEPGLALTPEERQRVTSMLDSPESWVREAGTWALDRSAAPGPRVALAGLALGAEKPGTRVRAVTALRELRRPGDLPVWLAALDDSCQSVRWTAMRALRDLAHPAAFDAIAARLGTDPYPPVRQMAVRAMGRYATPAAAAALQPALGDSVPDIRSMTRRVLRLIAPTTTPITLARAD